MSSSERKQIFIGLLAMGLVLITVLFYSDYLAIVRAIQLLATIALIFGIKKAPKQHKSKFLLFWLSVMTMWLLVCLYIAMTTLPELIRMDWYSLIVLLLSELVAAVIYYLMSIIYNDYVELTLGKQVTEDAEINLEPTCDSILVEGPTVNSKNENLCIS